MAEKVGMIRWFLKELSNLRESGIIDPATEVNLKEHFQARLAAAPSPQKYFLLSLSIVGSVLVAAGIILLFNYNWDMFTKATRIAIAFLPITFGAGLSVYTLTAGRPQTWREGSAVFTAAGTAVAIALLSHIYHTGGTLSEFMTLVLLLASPLLYIFNSIALATLYTFGLFTTLRSPGTTPGLSMVFGLTAAILPFVGWHLCRAASPYRIWMRYLTMWLGGFVLIAFGGKYSPGLMLYTACAVFMMAGLALLGRGEKTRHNPWLTISFYLLLIILSVGTSIEANFFTIRETNFEGMLYFWLFEGLFLILLGTLSVTEHLRKKGSFQHVMMLILVLIALCGTFCGIFRDAQIYTRLALNIYMGVFGVTLLIRGCRENGVFVFNGGLLTCTLLIGLRFFDADIGLLPRALGFIVLGLGFIGANIFFSRRLSQANPMEVNHAQG